MLCLAVLSLVAMWWGTAAVGAAPAPFTLTATAISATRIDLNWYNPPKPRQSFTVQRSVGNPSAFTTIASGVGANVTSYQDTSVAPDTTYYYRVLAVTKKGGAYSNVASAGTAPPSLNAPSGLTATAVSSSQINLTWVDNAADETGFKIERSLSATGGFSQIATVAANVTSYQDTGLTASTTYYYRVRAYNSVESDYSNVASATTLADPPPAPGALSASAVSSSQINLAWTDNSANESGFKIERSLSATSGFAQVATVGANVTTYQDTGLTAGTTYYYRVRAYNSAGDSGYSNTASATTMADPPAAPSGLSASAVSSTQINLAWIDNSANESGFKIERSLSATSGFVQVATVGANVTTYQNTGLTASTTYYYRVRAYNSAGDSGYSNVASATTLSGPPAAPSGLSATAASSSQINLAWTDNSANESGFKIERSLSASSGFAQVATVAANVTSYGDSGLAAGTTYYYRVRAYNSAGDSGYSNVASATTLSDPPAAPSGLSATAAGSSQINLAWTDNSANESGFKVERSLSATSGFAQIAIVAANVTAYQNTGLTAGTTYYYRVRAYNASADSSYSNTASATTLPDPPAAPSGLTASAVSSSQINLAWTDNSANESGFKIERSLSVSSGFAQIAIVAANVTSYGDSGLAAGTTYYYRVRAYNTGGDSGYSNTASATTSAPAGPPAAPTSLTASAVSTSQINLAWADNSTNESGFKVERSLTASSSGFAQIATVGANVTSYSDSGLSANTTYYYRVRAYNAGGDSGYSNTAAVRTLAPLPAAPSSLTATAVSISQINLAWTDNSTDESGFKIERSLAGGAFGQIATVGANVTTYSDTGLAMGTAYYYRMRSYNANGSSAYSNIALTCTLETAPAAPSSLTASTVSTSEINLSWMDNASNEDGFYVERSLSVTSGFAEIAALGANVRTYGDAGLAAGTTYYYRVRAHNSGGCSAYSNTASAATLTPPSVPLGTAMDVVTDGAYAYVASQEYGVVVVDVRDPADPHAVGAAEVGFAPTHLGIEGPIVVAVGGASGMAVVDVSNPIGPVWLSSLSGNAANVAISGQYAYLCDDYPGANGYLRVVSLANPSSPVQVANFDMGASVGYGYLPRDVAVLGGYAYVGTYQGVVVLDVSAPTAPRFVGKAGGGVGAVPLAAKPGFIYGGAADYGYGVGVGDVSIPTAPRWVGDVYLGCASAGLAVQGDFVYDAGQSTAGGPNLLAVIDVTAPTAPFVAGWRLTPGAANGVAVYGDHAYIADGASGLQVVDVTNPVDPVIVGSTTN
jgi:titin